MRSRLLLVCVTVLSLLLAVPTASGTSIGARGRDPHRHLHPRPFSFRMPTPPALRLGIPQPFPIPACRRSQVEGLATTQAGPHGVLGVVELRGDGATDRGCGLLFDHGPVALLDAHGHRLAVPLSTGNPVSPATGDFSPSGRTAEAWGFAWTAGYCGPPAASVLMRTSHPDGDRVVIPLVGPQPHCTSDPRTAGRSVLVPGPAGEPDEPVQSAPPAYRRLVLSAAFATATRPHRSGAIVVHATNTSAHPIQLTPCPEYDADATGEAADGGFAFSYPRHFFACDRVVAPGAAVAFRIRPRHFGSETATVGSTYSVVVKLSGTEPVTVSGTVRKAMPPQGGQARTTARGLRPSKNSFRLAAPSVHIVIGGIVLPRRTCRPGEIRALATTRRGPDGVLGVVEVEGAVLKAYTRCDLSIRHGPIALVDAQGHRLPVPLTRGNRVAGPTNYNAEQQAPEAGRASYGFAWSGSYCGPRAAGVLLRRDDRAHTRIVVPLVGPQPACEAGRASSSLVRGSVGYRYSPVQPAPEAYRRLALSAAFVGSTTTTRAAPVRVSLTNTSSAPIPLDPCPLVAAEYDDVRFSGPYRDRYLPCVDGPLTIARGAALSWTIPAFDLDGQGVGGPAQRGSTWYVTVGVAGSGVTTIHAVVQ